MKIGVLTGGGDCPGLNAVIRAVVRKSDSFGSRVVGFKNGWKGLVELSYIDLLPGMVSGLLHLGGTILGTSRTNPLKYEGGLEKIKKNLSRLDIDGIIAIGGEDTLGVANSLFKEGINVVGVPKTIDNDLSGTDFTFGFNTAVTIATEAIDRLHSTAESHNRIMVIEVMGRNTGWIATYSGLAGGADIILIPEIPIDLDEVCELLVKRHSRGKKFSIVVVAEGAKIGGKQGEEEHLITYEKRVDEFGHVRLGGIAQIIASEIERKTEYETRFVVLGHTQRGGSPTPYDRILATRFGISAAEMVKKGDFGNMAALSGDRIIAIPLEKAVAETKTVNLDIYRIAEEFFG